MACCVQYVVGKGFWRCVGVKWLLGWLVLCIVLTFIEVWNVGNYAHVAGFLFGYFTGNAFIARTFVPANIFGLALLVIISVVSLSYQP